MSVFRELPPTAGFRLRWQEVQSLWASREGHSSLAEDFTRHLDVPFAHVTYSGTAAFYVLLEALRTLSPKRTVVVPSYICPLVPLAIQRAGLRVAVCDVTPTDFNFNLPQLETLCASQTVLAILAVHLGGIPVELARLEDLAKAHGAFLIEDCAHALGAVYEGERVGRIGDAAFFSLCRGKGLTIYEGGVLVTKRREWVDLLRYHIRRLEKRNVFSESLKLLELLGYGLFYRPSLFWFVYRLPMTFWTLAGQPLRAEREQYAVDFPTHQVSPLRQRIGHAMFPRLEEEIQQQRKRAAGYREVLRGIPGITLMETPAHTQAIYPFVTVIVEDPPRCARVLQRLQKAGLGASRLYVCAITEYEYLRPILPDIPCPNGQHLAARVLTLSTSAYVTQEDIGAVATILKES